MGVVRRAERKGTAPLPDLSSRWHADGPVNLNGCQPHSMQDVEYVDAGASG
jgi:hypothetical protein